MIRFLNICVIAALVAAAAYVYKIKFESTKQAERVAKLRMEIRREHDAIAALRAEWSKLDNPARIQDLAKRHTTLRPIEARQFDKLRDLPERPPDLVPPDTFDPIGFLLEKPEVADLPTASIKPANTKAPDSRPAEPKVPASKAPEPNARAAEPKLFESKPKAPEPKAFEASRPPEPRPPEPRPLEPRSSESWPSGSRPTATFDPPRPSQPVPMR